MLVHSLEIIVIKRLQIVQPYKYRALNFPSFSRALNSLE